jgi:hypothetical protein
MSPMKRIFFLASSILLVMLTATMIFTGAISTASAETTAHPRPVAMTTTTATPIKHERAPPLFLDYDTGNIIHEKTLKVKAVDKSGAGQIRGVWTTIKTPEGVTLGSGFTPLTFVGREGTKYVVTVSNFEAKAFQQWRDDGSKSKQRTIILSNDTELAALYDTGNSFTGFTPLTFTRTKAGGPELTVKALALDGNKELHMWAIIVPQPQSASSKNNSNNSTTYKLYASNFYGYVFDHWNDGDRDRVHDVTVNKSMTMIAYYKLGSGIASGDSITPTAFVDSSISKIVRTQSGLVASDSLKTGDLSKWHLFGNAIATNAPHSGIEDKDGLHVGILAPSANRWSGYFAISPLTLAKLYHVRITLPDARPMKNSGMADAALYVQQEMYRDPRINSVGCGADIFPAATHWGVGWAQGNATMQTFHQAVYVDESPNQPTTRECTLVTNGDNKLTAYIDGEKVFSSDTMHLNMPKPFQSYLELQTDSNAPSQGQMFTGTFTDYYETAGEFLTVNGVKPGLVVRLTDGSSSSSGNVLSSAIATGNGTAQLDVGRYHMPLYGSLQVLDAKGVNILASTEGPLGNIYGGDVFGISDPAVEVRSEA